MVRQKVELKFIEDVQKRRVSFSKRRCGLMKKAHELSVLCNADVGLIVFSGSGRLYQFASSSMSRIITRYNLATGPSTSLAQSDLSPLLAQQAEEIRSLKEELMTMESENMSLLKKLNNQPICYKTANLETALTLRPPCFDVDMRMHRIEMMCIIVLKGMERSYVGETISPPSSPFVVASTSF
ncbi:hypothetical protein L2E82_29551 [Cichorium intybus]|uniref:Uncharacterized protein n=1 Tax=Cichorium intybus TaxID=13427 RepID=A0ACB9CXV4_CICIN|nr:hypothetical protein L2E82_29551 [Cichorium intybus]